MIHMYIYINVSIYMYVYIHLYILSYLYIYVHWSGAMVARVGLMIITCKAHRNGSEARAVSVRDPG